MSRRDKYLRNRDTGTTEPKPGLSRQTGTFGTIHLVRTQKGGGGATFPIQNAYKEGSEMIPFLPTKWMTSEGVLMTNYYL